MISEQNFALIAALDLAIIKKKLTSNPVAIWSAEKADAVERDYRCFLYLMKTLPDEPAAPSADVDKFWRLHILETRRYAADCEKVFGYFLHRSPYLRLRGEGEQEVLRRCTIA